MIGVDQVHALAIGRRNNRDDVRGIGQVDLLMRPTRRARALRRVLPDPIADRRLRWSRDTRRALPRSTHRYQFPIRVHWSQRRLGRFHHVNLFRSRGVGLANSRNDSRESLSLPSPNSANFGEASRSDGGGKPSCKYVNIISTLRRERANTTD